MKNTKTVRISGTYYCVYCGKEAICEREWEGRDYEDIYFCNCAIAKQELAMEQEIYEVKRKYPEVSPRKDIIDRINYNAELAALKRKYGVK